MYKKPEEKKHNPVFLASDLCTACGFCQLACSMAKTGEFNPDASRIKLSRVDGKERYAISFTEDCDQCGNCAKYCFYGVLRGGKIMANSAFHSKNGTRWF